MNYLIHRTHVNLLISLNPLIYELHETSAVWLLGDRDLNCVGWEDVLNEFWPFHETDRA